MKGKTSVLVWTQAPLTGDPTEEGDITNSKVLHKEKAFEPHIGHLAPGDGQWEGDPLI